MLVCCIYCLTFSCIQQGRELANAGYYYYFGMLSQSVVLECQQGSQIWLQSTADECRVHGSSSERESVFGGFILDRL